MRLIFLFIVFGFAVLCIPLMPLIQSVLLYKLAPRGVTFLTCLGLQLLAIGLAILVFLLPVLDGWFWRSSLPNYVHCLINQLFIIGADLLTGFIIFAAFALLSSLVVLSIGWRPHLLRAWFAATLTNAVMIVWVSATVVLLFAPAPFLVPLLAPKDRGVARIRVCYPPPLPLSASGER